LAVSQNCPAVLHTDADDKQSVPTEEHIRVVVGTEPVYVAVEGNTKVANPERENASWCIVNAEAPQRSVTLVKA
jgi:hypothetical protein